MRSEICGASAVTARAVDHVFQGEVAVALPAGAGRARVLATGHS